MNIEHRATSIAEIAASTVACPGEFRTKGGVREFMNDVADETEDVVEIAARILEHYCVDDGRYNNFVPGIALAVEFIQRETNHSCDVQSLKDLRHLLSDGPRAIRQWVESCCR